VDGEGVFHGGAIAPGAQMQLDALHARTAQLPQVKFERPADGEAFGRNTVGREPVFANATNAMAPGSVEAGGDLLDLAGCGLSEVRFVRIVDYPGDNRGADIDALAWIHWSEE
jgi:hypothetical protein